MSKFTPWFKISEFSPLRFGLYQLADYPVPKCQIKSPHYSKFDGTWHTSSWDKNQASEQLDISSGVAGGFYKVWRGLSEKPE